jgi:curved DNA-binding protein CbpA
MARRIEQSDPDYYALLQVSPHAARDEIVAAYERLQALYSPEYTALAAPELQALAAQKREQLAAAYAVLAQPSERAAYDRQHGFGSVSGVSPLPSEIDYRPLPPARGQERAVPGEPIKLPAGTRRVVRRQGLAAWLPPLVVAVTVCALLLLLVLSGVRTRSDAVALATPTVVLGTGATLPFTDVQIRQFRAAAETSNTAETWTAFGNALFNNLQTLRENAPQSPQYRSALGDWLTVAQAYERALALQESATLRADRAFALFNYGLDAPDPQRVAQAVAEVERGTTSGTTEPRALLIYGLVLSMTTPPRTEEALAQWRKLIEVAPQAEEVERAKALLESYGQD